MHLDLFLEGRAFHTPFAIHVRSLDLCFGISTSMRRRSPTVLSLGHFHSDCVCRGKYDDKSIRTVMIKIRFDVIIGGFGIGINVDGTQRIDP